MPKTSLETHTPVEIKEFKGLWANGKHDTTPHGYMQDCLNVAIPSIDEVFTRFGVSSIYVKPNIRRTFFYKRLNETSRYLVLDTAGNFFDSLFAVPLISNAQFEDFSVVNINNRAYITFHNRIRGFGSVYVYQGDGTIRLAAGTPPSAFVLSVVTSANSGHIEEGTHLFAISFETNTGFITAPGPEIFTVYEAPGGFKAIVSNIPIGPAGTVARWVIATQVQPDFDGNQLSPEYFFAHRIPDNTTTSVEVDFYDSELYVSADYLFDLMPTIPAGTFIFSYQDRLTLGGFDNPAHSVLSSKQRDYESFDTTLSRLIIDPSDAQSGCTNGLQFRNSMIITKGNRSYIAQGILENPSDWPVDSLDPGVGTQCFGIAQYIDAKGGTTERFFQADGSGIFLFESAIYKRNEFTYNIADIWKRVTRTAFNKVQLALDVENQVLYAAVPLDGATEVSHLLTGYFSDATSNYALIDAKKVRWTINTFQQRPSSILVDVDLGGRATFKYGSMDGDIHEQIPFQYLDNGIKIDSFVHFGPMQLMAGWVHHYSKLHFRIWGQGLLDLVIAGEDNSLQQTIPNAFDLSLLPGREFSRKINFMNEKMTVRLGTVNNANDRFTLFSLIVEMKPKWKSRLE